MRRKGELCPAEVDRRWPYQVAVEIPAGHGLGVVPAPGPLSLLCAHGHEVACDGRRYCVFCFSDPDQATHFRGIMGGIEFDPRDRGRGSHWGTWYRGRGPARDATRR